jgi:hypothetical protein
MEAAAFSETYVTIHQITVFMYTIYDNLTRPIIISCNKTITAYTSTTPIFLSFEPSSKKCNGVILLLGTQI